MGIELPGAERHLAAYLKGDRVFHRVGGVFPPREGRMKALKTGRHLQRIQFPAGKGLNDRAAGMGLVAFGDFGGSSGALIDLPNVMGVTPFMAGIGTSQ